MIELPKSRAALLSAHSLNYGLFKPYERQLIDQSWGNRIVHPPNVTDPADWSPDDPNIIGFQFMTFSFLVEQIRLNASELLFTNEPAKEDEYYLVSGPTYGLYRELVKRRKAE